MHFLICLVFFNFIFTISPLFSVQEATEKTLANEPLKAKENFPFPTSKQDVDPTKTHLTQVLTSTMSQLSAEENLSSNIPPGNKSIIEGEALEVQSEKEIPPEDESFDNWCQGLENQNGLPNCNLAFEDVRLPSTDAENICSTSQQPSCYTTKHVEMKNPIQQQGNSISPPDSEVNNRQQENDPVDTTSQPNFEDFALQLLTREDGKGPGPEELSPGELMPKNQISPPQNQKERETMGDCESPSLSTTALLLEWHRGERIQIRQAAERMLKALFQEFKYNVESIETRDLGAEAVAASPSVSPLHFRLACSYLIQILANAIRSEADSEEDISSDFLLCSEENPGREKNENANQPPESNISDGQMNATNSQEELFSSNMDPNSNPENLLCNSGAEEAARTPFTDGTEMDSRSNLNWGNYEVPFPNEGISSWISQANGRPADNTATYSFNTCVPQLVSSSHCLPWNKYLQGREKRRAFLHSFNNFEKNVMENQWLLKTRGYNQHAVGQNSPIASRLIGQSHRSLFRSNSN